VVTTGKKFNNYENFSPLLKYYITSEKDKAHIIIEIIFRKLIKSIIKFFSLLENI